MAGEKKVVPRCDGESVAHEDSAVAREGSSHTTGDTADRKLVVCLSRKMCCRFDDSAPVLSKYKIDAASAVSFNFGIWVFTYISGSLLMSAIAANGIPKFEAGPQKSEEHQHVSH